MKKLLAVLLIMSMSVSMLVGCGGNDKDNSKEPSKGTEAGTNQETEKEDEIDTSIYSEKVELRSDSEKKVVAFYDPSVVECSVGEKADGRPEVFLGEMMDVYVTHTATAEDYMNYVISVMGGEIGKHEESSLSGYAVHYFTLVEPGTGAFWDKIYVLELDAGVTLNFKLIGAIEEGSDFEKELAAIKFVVE